MFDVDLEQLEAKVTGALTNRNVGDLAVLGFGELSVALKVEGPNGPVVAKRSPPFRSGEFTPYRDLVNRYTDELRAKGVPVADTTVRGLERADGSTIAYLMQPLLDASTIGGDVLRTIEPVEEHPLLLAIGEQVLPVVDGSISIDAQVTNWSWDGGAPTLIDVGTPFLWTSAGDLEMDMNPFIRMLPAPARPLVKREMNKLTQRWRTPSGVLNDAVGQLLREKLDEWAQPASATWSRQLVEAGHEPTSLEAATKAYADDLKLWPMLKRLQRVERRYCNLRNRPYDYFIQSSMDGTLS
ncbi:MAG: hypothetical protein ACI8Y4_000647 [Candidatus Poriferisodalaceae bacterium]|jgi:hypothetical protein